MERQELQRLILDEFLLVYPREDANKATAFCVDQNKEFDPRNREAVVRSAHKAKIIKLNW
jgi:hypothetical protein